MRVHQFEKYEEGKLTLGLYEGKTSVEFSHQNDDPKEYFDDHLMTHDQENFEFEKNEPTI